MYPERLDGGEDFLLVSGEGDAHSEQVSMETERRVNECDCVGDRRGADCSVDVFYVNVEAILLSVDL